MTAAHRKKDFLIHEFDLCNFGIMKGDRCQSKVQLAAKKLLLKHLRAVKVLTDLHAFLPALAEKTHKQRIEQFCHRRADGDRGAGGFFIVIDKPLSLFDTVKGLGHLPVEILSNGRQADAPLFPFK